MTHGRRINIERAIRGERERQKQVGEEPDDVERQRKILLQMVHPELRSGTGIYAVEEWGGGQGGCQGPTALS